MNKKKKNEKLKKKRQKLNKNKNVKQDEILSEIENVQEEQESEILNENLSEEKVVKERLKEFGTKTKSFFKNLGSIIKIHFNLILFVIVGGLTLVNVTTHIIGSKITKGYENYSAYTLKYNKILEKQGTYYVYFYSENCSHCEDVKRYIFQYIDSEKSKDIPLYIFCIDNHLEELAATEEIPENVLGVTKIEDLKIQGTPVLLLVSDKTVQTSYASTSTIKEQLKK